MNTANPALGRSTFIAGGGIEWRLFTEAEAYDPMVALTSSRDREAFREFYAEYDPRSCQCTQYSSPVVTVPAFDEHRCDGAVTAYRDQ